MPTATSWTSTAPTSRAARTCQTRGMLVKARRRQRAEALLRERLSGADGVGLARARRARAAIRARRGATPFRVSLTPGLQAVHEPEPPARRPARRSARATRRSRRRAGSRSARRTPTAEQANSVGFVRYDVQSSATRTTSANEADVRVTPSVTDVRRQGTLADYTGELGVEQLVQITDRSNGPGQDEPGTAQADPFRFAVPCAATSDARPGGSCSLTLDLQRDPARLGGRGQARDLGAEQGRRLRRRHRRLVRAGRRRHAVRDAGRLRSVDPGRPGRASRKAS